MKVLVSYRGIPQSPGWATGDMVVSAFRALGHEVFPYAKYYEQNKWVENKIFGLDDHAWDLLLFLECNDGDPQYHELQLVKAKKTACWLFDTSYYKDQCHSLVNYFNFEHVFLANPLSVQQYKVWGRKQVYYLPYACDATLHGRPLNITKKHDAVLVGSIREDRIRLAKNLKDRGIHLELIGDVYREQYIDALASGKMVINQNPEAGRGLLNMRFWEAQAAGSLVFTEASDISANITAGLRDVITIPYSNVDLLVASMLRFLQHPKDLEIEINNSRLFALKHHTYQNRCEALLNAIFGGK